MKQQFKPGDVLEFTGYGICSKIKAKNGTKFTLKSVSSDDIFHFDNNDVCGFGYKHFKLAEEKQMTKFKVGSRVERRNYGKGTVVYIEEDHYKHHAKRTANLHIKWDNAGDTIDSINDEEYVTLLEKTMDNLQKGGVLQNSEHTYDRVVQGTIGDIVFTTDSDDNMARYDSYQTLEGKGWKIKGEEPEVTELTIEEIAEKLGVDSSTIRIKE